MQEAEKLFSEEDQRLIEVAIGEAERKTSGEIRLFIEDACKENVLDRAVFIFHKLEMEKTKERNGVLFYLAFSDRKFAILGDKGINEKTGNDFWHEIKVVMEHHFTEEDFVKGLTLGIGMAGLALSKHFPFDANTDKNELSDEIVFGE